MVSLELAMILQGRADSFVFEVFFNENQENRNSPTEYEGIIDLNNDLHPEEQMDEIIQLGDASHECTGAKPIENREFRRTARQAILGMARVVSGKSK